MQLTALVQGADHVCCRYRLEAFRPYLTEAGHDLRLRRFPRNPWDWLQLARELIAADLVIVQRRLLSRWQLFLLRRAARRLCFDFDDAVFLRDSYAVKGSLSRRRRRRFAAMARAADFIVAGNAFLRDQTLSWQCSEHVTVIPTCVEPRGYPLAGHERSGAGVEMVWIGSASTLNGLEMISPLLEGLGQRWPGLRLKLICDEFLSFQHLTIMPRAWSSATETEELATADIGISWLPDDPWSRGKCGLKILQYMAAGLPVVANPVGVQATMIEHGQTGYLAETPDEWQEAIGRLMHDAELRRRFGQAARRRVEERYSVALGAQQWLKLLDRQATAPSLAS